MADKIELTRLREYTSKTNGKRYFSGYLGGAKILIFRDDRAEVPAGCEAIWTVFLEQAEVRPSAGSGQRQASAPAPTRSPAPADDRHVTRGKDFREPMPDDPMPF